MVILERSNGFYGGYEKTDTGYEQKFNVKASLFIKINQAINQGYHLTFLDRSHEEEFMKDRTVII